MIDGNGKEVKEGERVATFDIDGSMVYGTLHRNVEFPHVSDYYVKFDDGEECAVLDMDLIFKV